MKYVIKSENGVIYAKYMTSREELTDIEIEITEDEFELVKVPCRAEYEDGRIIATNPCNVPEISCEIKQLEPPKSEPTNEDIFNALLGVSE